MANLLNPPLSAGSIVVGVDGSEHADRAVAWAAHQAALESRPVSLLHGSAEVELRNTAWLDREGIDHAVLHDELQAADEAIMLRAVERVRTLEPSVRVTSHLALTDARSALVGASGEAHLLVLGSRGRGPVASMLLGSVSGWVAAHSRCPLVVVRPAQENLHTAGVVVGADGTSASVPVIEFAFRQASLRRTRLTVMHAIWQVPSEAVDRPVRNPQDLDEAGLLLAQSVAGLGEKFPDVPVTYELRRGLTDEVLAGASPTSELLVVGRPRHGLLTRIMYGSTTAAVLERAAGPVAVVPEKPGGPEAAG